MRIRTQSNTPDAWVIAAIVLAGAGIILAISILRSTTTDPRPASPLDAPSVAPTAPPAIVDPTAAPTTAAGTTGPATSPLRTFTPAESPLPNESAIPAPNTPDLPPPGYRLDDQD